ncbi:MAG: phosphotransferase enzyme family protein, partial [Eubacteriales bacterium]
MREDLTEIGKAFGLKGTLSGYEIVKNGNINETYRVTYKTDDGGKEVYIFQRVNTYVFRRPEEIMANIERVTSHIREKSVGRPTLCFYHTPSGANYICRQDGSFWRIMNFIDSVTFDVCDRPDIIRAAGEAFGEFQLQLSDFDGSVLYETIADFHNTRRRLDTLFDDAERDPVGRAAGTAAELEKIRAFADAACQLCDRYGRHEFPVRVTHNDTKASNVLFDRQTLRPLAV